MCLRARRCVLHCAACIVAHHVRAQLLTAVPGRPSTVGRCLKTLAAYNKALAEIVAAHPAALQQPWTSLEHVETFLRHLFSPDVKYSRVEKARAAVLAYHQQQNWAPPPWFVHGHYFDVVWNGFKTVCARATRRRTTGSALEPDEAAALVRFWREISPDHSCASSAQRNAVILAVQFATGVRIHEVLAMCHFDVHDLGAARGFRWFVPRSKREKNGIDRVIPESVGVPESTCFIPAAGLLRSWMRQHDFTQPQLFVSKSAQQRLLTLRLVNVQLPPLTADAWNKAFRGAILHCPATASLDPADFSSHASRRGISTALAELGVAEYAVKSVLGHRSKGATGLYVQPSSNKKQRLLDSVGASSASVFVAPPARQAAALPMRMVHFGAAPKPAGRGAGGASAAPSVRSCHPHGAAAAAPAGFPATQIVDVDHPSFATAQPFPPTQPAVSTQQMAPGAQRRTYAALTRGAAGNVQQGSALQARFGPFGAAPKALSGARGGGGRAPAAQGARHGGVQ
jgi:integrase